MSFDTLTVTALAQELEAALVGGRVQKVLLPDEVSVGLEIYARRRTHHLLICASGSTPHAYLASKALRRGTDHESPLLLLLRKYVRGGRILAIRQPPLERVLVLQISSIDSKSGESRIIELVAELIGRHGNVILVDEEGLVMDSMKRVSPSVNRYRTIGPKRPYVPPPPLGKPHPSNVGPGELEAVAALRGDEPAWNVLVGCVAGLGPLVARESIYRSTGRTGLMASEVVSWDGPLGDLREIFSSVESGRLNTVVALDNGAPVEYAAYDLRQYQDTESVESTSLAIERFHTELTDEREFRSPRAARLRVALADKQALHLRRLESLKMSLEESRKATTLRRKGELVMAHAVSIQAGAASTRLDGQEIRLDPNLTPVENAQLYFKRYRKANSADQKIPDLMTRAESEAQFVAQALVDLELAESDSELAELERVFSEIGLIDSKARRPRGQTKTRATSFEIDGWQVLLGRNAAQNDHLTFKVAEPDDLWVHARGVPGAHVVVRSQRGIVPDRVIESAARLAAGFSGSRFDTNVDVDVTRRRFVRRTRGGQRGQASYRSEQTYRVKPARDIESD